MRRGTTPTLRLTVAEDLTNWWCYITLECRDFTLTKSGADVECHYDNVREVSTLTVVLTQEETLQLTAGKTARVQLRAIYEGTSIASKIVTVKVGDVLLDGVIEDESEASND